MINQIKTKKNINGEIKILIDKFFGFVVIFVAIVILVIGYFILIQDEYGEIRRKEKVDLIRIQSLIDKLAREDIQGKHANQLLEFTPVEEHMISLALPDEFDLPSLMIQLEGMAKKNNFAVESIEAKYPTVAADNKKNKTATANVPLKKINVGVTVVGGNYDNFKAFLGSLENSIMIFDPSSVAFTGDGANQKYKLNLVTYYYN